MSAVRSLDPLTWHTVDVDLTNIHAHPDNFEVVMSQARIFLLRFILDDWSNIGGRIYFRNFRFTEF